MYRNNLFESLKESVDKQRKQESNSKRLEPKEIYRDKAIREFENEVLQQIEKQESRKID
jgi:hypothetical protein